MASDQLTVEQQDAAIAIDGLWHILITVCSPDDALRTEMIEAVAEAFAAHRQSEASLPAEAVSVMEQIAADRFGVRFEDARTISLERRDLARAALSRIQSTEGSVEDAV